MQHMPRGSESLSHALLPKAHASIFTRCFWAELLASLFWLVLLDGAFGQVLLAGAVDWCFFGQRLQLNFQASHVRSFSCYFWILIVADLPSKWLYIPGGLLYLDSMVVHNLASCRRWHQLLGKCCLLQATSCEELLYLVLVLRILQQRLLIALALLLT